MDSRQTLADKPFNQMLVKRSESVQTCVSGLAELKEVDLTPTRDDGEFDRWQPKISLPHRYQSTSSSTRAFSYTSCLPTC